MRPVPPAKYAEPDFASDARRCIVTARSFLGGSSFGRELEKFVFLGEST